MEPTGPALEGEVLNWTSREVSIFLLFHSNPQLLKLFNPPPLPPSSARNITRCGPPGPIYWHCRTAGLGTSLSFN